MAERRAPDALDRLQRAGHHRPGVVRIELATGSVATIVTGTTSCDPTRRTPWGTIVFGEEAGQSGQALRTDRPVEHDWRNARPSDRHVQRRCRRSRTSITRTALGTGPFEGFGILDDGTTYVDGDDSGFGPKNGGPGNFFYKFIPSTPFTGTATDHRSRAVAVRRGRRTSVCESVSAPTTARAVSSASPNGSHSPTPTTRTSRPPDSRRGSPATTAWKTPTSTTSRSRTEWSGCARHRPATRPTTSTARSSASPTAPSRKREANTAVPEMQPFVFGGTSQGINMPDNIAFQPRTGNAMLHEDAETTFETPHNNDLWDCLPDGADQDLLSDGCIRIATLNDLTAEWTGGIFDASGKHFYVSIQHNISGQATILDITGWDVPHND